MRLFCEIFYNLVDVFLFRNFVFFVKWRIFLHFKMYSRSMSKCPILCSKNSDTLEHIESSDMRLAFRWSRTIKKNWYQMKKKSHQDASCQSCHTRNNESQVEASASFFHCHKAIRATAPSGNKYYCHCLTSAQARFARHKIPSFSTTYPD